LVQFTAVGAAAFLHRPLDEFFNSTVALDEAMGRSGMGHCLHEQLASARNHAVRIRLLEGFLLAHVADARPDPLVSAAVSWIERASPAGRIDVLARHIGLSQSALERRFRRVVGTTPRKFASIVRLQQVLHLRKAGHDLTSIAHIAGYFDQSHFIHDFRRLTGAAPEAYFAQTAAR
jgi:AraC-like DNA-binding protein